MVKLAKITSDGLKVRLGPGQDYKVIDALDPKMTIQLLGPEVKKGAITWVEHTYTRSGDKPCRGWSSLKWLDVYDDPQFDTGETVHERQVRYEKSVTFPQQDEPAILDTARRAAFRWFDLFVAILPAILVLSLLYGCVK